MSNLIQQIISNAQGDRSQLIKGLDKLPLNTTLYYKPFLSTMYIYRSEPDIIQVDNTSGQWVSVTINLQTFADLLLGKILWYSLDWS